MNGITDWPTSVVAAAYRGPRGFDRRDLQCVLQRVEQAERGEQPRPAERASQCRHGGHAVRGRREQACQRSCQSRRDQSGETSVEIIDEVGKGAEDVELFVEECGRGKRDRAIEGDGGDQGVVPRAGSVQHSHAVTTPLQRPEGANPASRRSPELLRPDLV